MASGDNKAVVAAAATTVTVLAALYACKSIAESSLFQKKRKSIGHPEFKINSMGKLREVIPVKKKGGRGLTATKVLKSLDQQMVGFIERSPFIQVGTSSSSGLPFVSPKGDGNGFVKILDNETLVIPDRPGNNIIMGHENILENPHVGLIFEIPGNNMTLRVGGFAELTTDPKLCNLTRERGRDAIMCLVVHIEYAFFHCAKAYMRSKLWKPETWPEERYPVSFAPYFCADETKWAEYDVASDGRIQAVADSIAGLCDEPLTHKA